MVTSYKVFCIVIFPNIYVLDTFENTLIDRTNVLVVRFMDFSEAFEFRFKTIFNGFLGKLTLPILNNYFNILRYSSNNVVIYLYTILKIYC